MKKSEMTIENKSKSYEKPVLDVKKLNDLAKAYAVKSGMSGC